MHDQTWIYDPEADNWSEDKAAPQKHAKTVCASLGDWIHVIGGRVPKNASNSDYRDHIDTDRHLVLSPSDGNWSKAAPATVRRNSAAGNVIDGLLYVVGGRNMADGNLADLEFYDAKEDRWHRGAPMPQAQGDLAATAQGGKLYAFGGDYRENGGGVFSECWVYDPAHDQWEASVPMLTPRHGLCAATLDGWVYSVGGARKPGGKGTSDALERFLPN